MMFIIERSTIMEKRNSLKMLFILIGIACVCNSCNLSKDNGFELEEFAIDNAGLHSVVDSVINMYSPVLQSTDEKKILSLNLSHKDSVLLFIFSIRDEEELLNMYIFRDNKRIVGYTTIGKEDIILLSDIDDLPELGELFGSFIHPTGISKELSYMKYPNNLYIGEGVNVWPKYELIYDPTYLIYPFINNTFLQPIMTKNPSIIRAAQSR